MSKSNHADSTHPILCPLGLILSLPHALPLPKIQQQWQLLVQQYKPSIRAPALEMSSPLATLLLTHA